MIDRQEDSPFRIIPGDPRSSIIVHVPHASTVIPSWVRQHILLSDEELQHELSFMTDALTDAIATRAAQTSSLRPWLFVNGLSRLVIDPERFPDASQEPMAAPEIGMGAVYKKTALGAALRHSDPIHEAQLLETFFDPYASELSQLVDDRLEALGAATLIDLHSFPKDELPYERLHHADALRPALCVGADDFHTPHELVEASRAAFANLGESIVNSPFQGAYVPLNKYRSDQRVQSVMIEVRRDTYLGSDTDLQAVAHMLAALLNWLSRDAASGS